MSRSSALSKLKSVLQKSKESKQSQSRNDKTSETEAASTEPITNLQNESDEQVNRVHRPQFMTVAALKAKNMAENARSRSFKAFIEDTKQSETEKQRPTENESFTLSISSSSTPIDISIDEDISDRSNKARESTKSLLRDAFWATPEGRSIKDTLHYRAEQEAIALVMEAKSKLYEDIKAGAVVIRERASCIDFPSESYSTEHPDDLLSEGQKDYGNGSSGSNVHNKDNNINSHSGGDSISKSSSPWAWGRGSASLSSSLPRRDDRREKRESKLHSGQQRGHYHHNELQDRDLRDRDYRRFERDVKPNRTHGYQPARSESEDDNDYDSQDEFAFDEFEERALKKNDALVQTGNLSSRNPNPTSTVKTVSMYDLRKKQQNFISITYERNLREFLISHYKDKKT